MYSKRTFPPLTMPCRQSQHCLQCKLVNQLADAVVHLFAIACHTNRAKSEIPSRKTLGREVWLESSCRVDSHKQTPESPAKEQVQQLLCIVEIAGASPNRGFHPIRVVRFSL